MALFSASMMSFLLDGRIIQCIHVIYPVAMCVWRCVCGCVGVWGGGVNT